MTELVFNLPDENTPGYLRRQKEALKLQQRIQEKLSPETVDDIVNFLAPYIAEPKDPKQAKEALWDASKAQFNQLLNSVIGLDEGDENPTE